MMGIENVPIEPDGKWMAAWRRLTLIPCLLGLFIVGVIGLVVVIITWIPCGTQVRNWWRDMMIDPITEFISKVQ